MSALLSLLVQIAALVTATAVTAILGLVIRALDKLDNIDRAINGDKTTEWRGLVERNREHREALEEEGLL
jgi:hypothetical protein